MAGPDMLSGRVISWNLGEGEVMLVTFGERNFVQTRAGHVSASGRLGGVLPAMPGGTSVIDLAGHLSAPSDMCRGRGPQTILAVKVNLIYGVQVVDGVGKAIAVLIAPRIGDPVQSVPMYADKAAQIDLTLTCAREDGSVTDAVVLKLKLARGWNVARLSVVTRAGPPELTVTTVEATPGFPATWDFAKLGRAP